MQANAIIEIRIYNLIPGTKSEFDQLVVTQSIPLLKKWNIEVIGYGSSLHDKNSYYLIRTFRSIEERQEQEVAFYGSNDWLKGPRVAITSLIENYTTVVLRRFINGVGKFNKRIIIIIE